MKYLKNDIPLHTSRLSMLSMVLPSYFDCIPKYMFNIVLLCSVYIQYISIHIHIYIYINVHTIIKSPFNKWSYPDSYIYTSLIVPISTSGAIRIHVLSCIYTSLIF